MNRRTRRASFACSTFAVIGAALTALVTAALLPACSSQPGDAGGADAAADGGAQIGLYEQYDVSGDIAASGDIETIDFLDAHHYTLERSAGSEDVYEESGTYVLDIDSGTLALTDDDSGETETIPFEAGDVSDGPPVDLSSAPLHTLGGGLTGSGTALTGSQQTLTKPLCSFNSNKTTFKSTGSACKPTTDPSNPSNQGVFLAQSGDCVPAVFQSYSSEGTPEKIFATIKTVPDATTTASYTGHLPAHTSANNIPQCFIDMNNVVDGLTGATLGKSVKISEHYTLTQLTAAQSSSPDRFVVLDNQAVRYLEKFVAQYGVVPVTSGFRAPSHQAQTCENMCKAVSCCGSKPQSGKCTVTCARASRHMFGKAFDLPVKYTVEPYTGAACKDGFTFVYNENSGGHHLHIDTSFPFGSCVKQGLK
jgi:hypothetical protein